MPKPSRHLLFFEAFKQTKLTYEGLQSLSSENCHRRSGGKVLSGYRERLFSGESAC